jgi:hypothetical protein
MYDPYGRQGKHVWVVVVVVVVAAVVLVVTVVSVPAVIATIRFYTIRAGGHFQLGQCFSQFHLGTDASCPFLLSFLFPF